MAQNPKDSLYNRTCEGEMIKWHNPPHHPHGNCLTMKSYGWWKGKMLFLLDAKYCFKICKLGKDSEELFLSPSFFSVSQQLTFILPSIPFLISLRILNSAPQAATAN